MATKRKIDWPQVAAFSVVVTAVVVLVLRLDPEKAEAWLAMAPAILGAIGMGYSMLRGRAVEASVPVPKRADRERSTLTPPPGEEGSVQLGALLWLALAGGLALLLTLPGCGASALSAHARAATVMTVAIEGADRLADVGGETAMLACETEQCTHDVEAAIAAIDAAIATADLPVRAYAQAIEMAATGGEDVDVLSALAAVLLRALDAWEALVPLYAPLGVELPQLPRSIHALVELVLAVAGAGS